MDIGGVVRARGGVMRVQTLRRHGVSATRIRAAKQRGEIITLRRGWVGVPDAAPLLSAAARKGVVLTCVTAAAHHGLWVPDKSEVHVAAPAHSGHVPAVRGVVHWSTPHFPRNPDECVDSVENALIQVARCLPFEEAVVIWESALRQGLIDPGVFARTDLPSTVREVMEAARPFADSGLETICVLRLRWMGLRLLPQAWILDHRVDLLIGERLVVQIDGAHHTGAQRTSDIEHDAQLMLHGYHVLRFSYEQIMEHWHDVQQVIMDAVAQRLHLA